MTIVKCKVEVNTETEIISMERIDDYLILEYEQKRINRRWKTLFQRVASQGA